MVRSFMACCGACAIGLGMSLTARAQAPLPLEGTPLPPISQPEPLPPIKAPASAPAMPVAPPSVVPALAAAPAAVETKPTADRIEGPSKLMLPPKGPTADFVPVPEAAAQFVESPMDPPLGFTGHTSITPSVVSDGDWVPIEDRWRLGFPSWDRYGTGHPPVDDYPFALGNIWDPYSQNVLKGDYPIIGQHTFLALTATAHLEYDPRQIPIGTTPFESTARPHEREFFGSPNFQLQNNFVRLNIDLFHGDTAYKPADWRVVVTPIFDYNQVNVDELGVVSPDVRKGTQRERTYTTVEEYFVEAKLADLSPYYDFVSLRVGSQFFDNDFRGFLFDDTNRAVRLFGTLFANRDQFNLAFFRQAEKDTDSGLEHVQ